MSIYNFESGKKKRKKKKRLMYHQKHSAYVPRDAQGQHGTQACPHRSGLMVDVWRLWVLWQPSILAGSPPAYIYP